MWAAGIAVLFPVVWIALASVKTPEQLNDPFLLSFTPTLASWRNVLSSGILEAAGRSAIVALITVGISTVVGSMGAYAIARYRAGGTATRFGMLAAQVLPPAVLVFPFLTMAYALRLNDTLVPVIFAHLSFVLPVVTWFLIGFFEAVPRSLEEQALVDGFTRFQAFRLVVLPQVLPGHRSRGHLRIHAVLERSFLRADPGAGQGRDPSGGHRRLQHVPRCADRLDERGDPDRGRPCRRRKLLHSAQAGAGHQWRRGEVLSKVGDSLLNGNGPILQRQQGFRLDVRGQ